MSAFHFPAKLGGAMGGLLLLVGSSVFLVRFQHAGPYGFPGGGNLLAAALALGLGALLLRPSIAVLLSWAALLASPVVLFFALYATLAELEEVIVLKATDLAGQPADLRLWVVDHAGAAWVTMPRTKADAHRLGESELELLRRGELTCVTATRHEDRATANQIHELRQEKYAIQRLATSIGLFGSEAAEQTIALRLDPCVAGSTP